MNLSGYKIAVATFGSLNQLFDCFLLVFLYAAKLPATLELNRNIMSKAWHENWTMNSFASLLADAIAFDFQAQRKSTLDFPATNRYSKASVTNAILSIEAAANSCIARMTYPELVVQQLDKLSILDKYDVLYTARFGKKVDRGSKPFQVVRELFQLRNRYVHPKLEKIKTKITISKKNEKTYEKAPKHCKNTSILKIPYDFTTWTGEHSRKVVKEVINFFNHFFTELCGLDAKECSELLSVFVKGPVNTAIFLAVHEIDILKKAQKEYGVEIKFLVF